MTYIETSEGMNEQVSTSVSVETKLVDTLFDQYDSIVVGQLGVVAIATLSYFVNRSP